MAKALVTWATAIAATVAAFGMPAQSGHDLFQQALVKERAEGNLQEAIDLYDRIVHDFPDDHALAAKALVQMGQCYEKLGKAEARKAYERVIRDYADQAEPLQVARARLAALTRPPRPEMTVRRVWSDPSADVGGEISPDGRYLSFVDWETGDLAVRDLTTGRNRRLTNKGSWEDSPEFAESSRWSPDGEQLAYDWWRPAPACSELRVLGLEDTRPRLLYAPEEGACLVLVDWSPDGREILVVLRSDGKTPDLLAAVSVADGTIRIIKGMERRYPWDSAEGISPDGRYILYTHPPSDDSDATDLFVVSSDGQSTTRLMDHPANDMAAGWSPDGRWVLFVSDRSGTLDLWILRVDEGRPVGEPRLMKSGSGRIASLGFDNAGRYYYGIWPQVQDIFTVTLDPSTGRALTAPSRTIGRFQGMNNWPSYSRDGSHMAYMSARGSLTAARVRFNVLCIRSLDGSEEQDFVIDARRLVDPRFSSDEKSVFFGAFDDAARMGFYRLDAATGERSPVVEVNTDQGLRLTGYAVSPDGSTFFYSRCEEAEKACRLLKRDLTTGAETEIYRVPDAERVTLALAPDGESLAFLNRNIEGPERTERIVWVVPARGGEPREIHRFTGVTSRWIPLEFSADGKSLFIPQETTPSEDQYWTLLRVPVGGGAPQDLGLKMTSFQRVTAHPDGERIAFCSRGLEERRIEVWVLEDFLPEATGRP